MTPRAGLSLRPRPSETRTAAPAPSYWARTYTGFMGKLEEGYVERDSCTSAQPGADGGVVVAGYAASQSTGAFIGFDWRPLVVELDPSGELAWMVLYQEDSSKKGANMVNSLIRTRDGGYLAAGAIGTEEPFEYHALVMKLADAPQMPHQQNDPYHHYSYGPMQWVKTFGFGSQIAGEYERANAVAETPDGGYVIAGASSIIGFWIAKLDQSGNLLWQESLGSDLAIYALTATTDGGFVLVGESLGNLMVIRFGSTGAVQWQRSYAWLDPAAKCGGYGIETASCSSAVDGEFIVSGATEFGPSSCHDGSACGWVCKLDQSGRMLWQKGFNNFYCYHGFGTPDGGTVVMSEHVALSLSPEGSQQWQKSYQDLFLTCGFQADGGGYVLGGWYWLPDPDFQDRIAVVRLDSAGNIGPDCSAVWGASITERKGALTAVSLSPLSLSYPTIWMNSLENNSQARPCQIQTICGPSLNPRRTRSREPLQKD